MLSGAFLRGGNWNNGANAGAFTLNLNNAPANSDTNIGFRCARYFSKFGPNEILQRLVSAKKLRIEFLFLVRIKAAMRKYHARFPGQLKNFHLLGARGHKLRCLTKFALFKICIWLI